ncbi:MAG TPA: glutathione S-transferase family protein [Limnobacter sp.]|nr:glutathione S-transferase family protein [Limnobacter sp.]
MALPEILKVHGLDLSYFTGKLEAYLRGKKIPYELIEMDTRDFRQCGKATGVAQMPQVEWTGGQWLSDTTLIIEFLENMLPGSTIMPTCPAMKFMAQLLEDFGDEWLWRPALYYRWANAADARLMSHRLAKGMLRDVPAPFFMRRWAILNRQRFHFLWLDGVRPGNAKRVEEHYLETLDVLEIILRNHPFILGQRPTLADYGLYGSMFRHFFCDPTPAGIMRTRAPAVHEWVARMWNLDLKDHAATGFEQECHPEMQALLQIVCKEFIPYMQANEQAHVQGRKTFRFNSAGSQFKLPAQRYRAWRYQRLCMRYQALDEAARSKLARWAPELGELLGKPIVSVILPRIESLPIKQATTVAGRAW